MSLKARITEDMKTAMKARETARLGAIRLLLAAVKQREVDDRVELDDAGVLAVIDKMLKQRRDSITQYEKAGRQDLVDAEKLEVGVLTGYMPQALSGAEIQAAVDEAIAASGAAGELRLEDRHDLAHVLHAGRADMSQVSGLVKAALAK